MRCESCIFLTTLLIMVCLIDDVAMASEKRRWYRGRRRRRCQKQNCVPGQWSPWSPCSRSCGPHGHSRKSRLIIKPASCGGTCLVTTIGAKACNRFCLNGGTLIRLSCRCKAGYSGECCEKVSGGWTSWGAWCACSRTCGRGTQYRKRSCTKPGGTGCVGSSKEYRSCIVKQCNLDGGWSSWSSWGQCTGSCGSGLQTRKRTCTNPPPGYGGKKCSGPAEQHKNCLLQRCPVNGGWSAWRPWSKCSKTCGSGFQYTNRYCNNPTPKYGGKPCVGQNRKTRACSIRSCAVDGGWSPWGKWCKCSKTCGTGSQYRTRSCTRPPPGYGGKPCEGQDKQYRSCNTKQCPVHGGWSNWSVWGACSKTCGDGKQYSKRYCNNPVPNGGRKCYGANVRTRACNVKPCPVNGRWSLWSAWSKCSRTCGYGRQTRLRTCTNPPPKYGGKCVGPNTQAKSCLVKKCPVNGRWSLWSAWSKCSKTCGYGSQTRRRTCTNPPPKYGGRCVGPNMQAKSCLVKNCPVNGGWSAWGNWCACSKTCGTGTQHRSRSCDKPSPAHGGKHCSGQNKEFRNCNTNQCPVNGRWSLWARWSTCSKTCGTGSKTRKRSCSNPPAQHGGKPCKGVNEQTKSCLLKTCPTPAYGGWGSWGAWSTCSRTCGTGSQNRKRTCQGGAGAGNCHGSHQETQDCNTQKCPVNGRWSLWTRWSTCSKTCGTGSKTRKRSCSNPPAQHGGKPCKGVNEQTKSCLLKTCPTPAYGGWSSWSAWSACSKTCGTGSQNRKRTCQGGNAGQGNCPGSDEEKRDCNTQKCPVNGRWSLWAQWSTCSKTCGTGSKTRKRSCSNPPAQHGGKPCKGVNEKTNPCLLKTCPTPAPVVNGGWGDWSEWSACTVSCGPGTSLRTRRCDSPAPGPGGSPCVGLPVSNKPCDLGPCPRNCWGDWSDWSKCTKACGCGRRFRVRFCNCAHGQGHDQCQGLGESSESCNCNDCPNGPPF